MALPSDVDICANALRKLGDDPITSLTDNSDRARLCNALYEPTRDAVLRAHPWNCALTRASLAELALTQSWEYYAHAYQLPEDPYCLRVLKTDGEIDGYEWKVEGRRILTDAAAPLKILYIARITDPALYDALLYEALTARMAAELAFPITSDLNKASLFMQLYDRKMQEARSMDGMEGTPEAFENTVLLDVR